LKQRLFYILKTEGGEFSLAFTKDEKTEMMAQYREWLSKSQAVVLVEYTKMTQKDVDAIRAKARDAGGEMHIVKNTLFAKVLDDMGIKHGKMLEKTTLVGFAFNDAPAFAKVVNDSTKSDVFKVKGGVLGGASLTPAQVKSLADMPPLPVMRAQLLGVLSAPASKLVRTLAEPGRSIAGVIKAYSEQSAPVAA
jgi:large subunit ribosomal protein L10